MLADLASFAESPNVFFETLASCSYVSCVSKDGNSHAVC